MKIIIIDIQLLSVCVKLNLLKIAHKEASRTSITRACRKSLHHYFLEHGNFLLFSFCSVLNGLNSFVDVRMKLNIKKISKLFRVASAQKVVMIFNVYSSEK
jgi:hypothetical protein